MGFRFATESPRYLMNIIHKYKQVSATYIYSMPGERGFLIDQPNSNRKLKLS